MNLAARSIFSSSFSNQLEIDQLSTTKRLRARARYIRLFCNLIIACTRALIGSSSAKYYCTKENAVPCRAVLYLAASFIVRSIHPWWRAARAVISFEHQLKRLLLLLCLFSDFLSATAACAGV